jgi:hypothetical protein
MNNLFLQDQNAEQIAFAEHPLKRTLAGGWAWTLPVRSINLKLEKCLKMPKNPTSQVHAVLGAFL